ncbi:MAG: polysaccharide biosynthesis/export family protein [Elstera sp.]|jgi:polysaccharide export outer membrane protein|uniref:polysaccharide biosynthesis/export family protein n=1 Tax=Elstera sp. TaxID=1916664 RepID=UPI0037C19761
MINRRHCLLLLSTALAFGGIGGARAQGAEAGIGEYRLGPGDRVRIQVFNEADLSGDYDIDGTGLISLPLIGQMSAGGLRVAELEASIVKSLGNGFLKNPRVTVVVLTYRPFYIYGEVRQPGGFPYVNGMRMVNAVVLAGGYTPRARQGRLLITRLVNGQKTELEGDDDTPVLPGDIIRVPERFF